MTRPSSTIHHLPSVVSQHGRLTFSKIELAETCRASMALQHIGETNEYAEDGHENHAAIQKALVATARGEKPPKEIREAVMWAVSQTGRGVLSTEVPLAYRPSTGEGRELPEGPAGHRDYSAALPDEIPGTADVVIVRDEPDGTRKVIVPDWKSGFQDVDHPADNRQIQAQVLSAARAHQADIGVGVVAYVRPSGFSVVEHVFDQSGLKQVATEIDGIWWTVQEARARIGDGSSVTPDFNVGPHCSMCPARLKCPAQSSAAQALVKIGDRVNFMTDAELARTWEMARAVEGVVEVVKKAVKARVTALGSIDLPNGKRLREIKKGRDVIDKEAAFNRLGLPAFLVACSVTKTGIEKSVGEEEAEKLIADMKTKGEIITVEESGGLREVKK